MRNLLLCLVLFSCSPRGETAAAGAPSASAAAARTLQVVPVVSRQPDSSTHLQGELLPYEAVSLFSKVGGFVSRVDVDRGSVVKNGQVLVIVSAPELAAQRAEAEAKMQADRSTFDRFKAAAQTPGAVAGHELELQEAAVHADDARVQSLRTLEQYLVVRAPFDGVITERNIHPGAFVGPATGDKTPMLRVEQVARLRLTVAVPERYVGEVTEGAAATFSVSTWPNEKFNGVAKRISHSIDPRSRSMPVELDVDNAAGRLTPGMFVNVTWALKRPSQTLWVPSTAVVQSTEKTFVVRVRDGIVEQVPVQRGSVTPNLVEVFGALEAGDLVAKRGSEELRPGMHVESHTSPPPAPSGSAP
jgi:membrane fusion protein (multidrug efflux system)